MTTGRDSLFAFLSDLCEGPPRAPVEGTYTFIERSLYRRLIAVAEAAQIQRDAEPDNTVRGVVVALAALKNWAEEAMADHA